jgi:menaquinone-dependent protoporphyrinogen IX oxidase
MRCSRYRWLRRRLRQRIARKHGGNTDVARDHEHTDWVDLTRLVSELLAALGSMRGVV